MDRSLVLRGIPPLLIIGCVVAAFVMLRPGGAKADRVILKDDGYLYFISETLGEKRVSAGANIKFLFGEKGSKVLYGKGLEGGVPESSIIGGTKLFVANTDGTDEIPVSNELIAHAALDERGQNVFFTDLARNLFLFSLEDGSTKKLQEKVLSPAVSPDGRYVVYQKLNSDWQEGQMFDQALGLTLLDLTTGQEKQLTNKWEDFNPIWTPDGKKILFFSASPEGLASHFIINADGTGRKQLTNVGQRFVTALTVSMPSDIPVWSKDGKFLAYESDKEVWVNEFDVNMSSIKNARSLAFGRQPKWLNSTTLTILASKGQNRDSSILTIDVHGNIQK